MHCCRPLCMAVWCLSTCDVFTHTEEAFLRYSGDKRTRFWVHGATGKQDALKDLNGVYCANPAAMSPPSCSGLDWILWFSCQRLPVPPWFYVYYLYGGNFCCNVHRHQNHVPYHGRELSHPQGFCKPHFLPVVQSTEERRRENH